MNIEAVEKIANAVLYEGYILYPYRPSAIKNRQRFNFGVLYPREYCDFQLGAESWEMKTECLVLGSASTTVEVKTRFLQMANRQNSQEQDWQEGVERDVCAPPCTLESIEAQPLRQRFTFQCDEEIEGELELRSSEIDLNVFKVTLTVRNLVTLGSATRDQALLRSLVSVHSILQVENGEFVSLLDPPEHLKATASECQNAGAWPVLAGEEGQRNLVLCSPIILYDYPQIAPESAGDLCDGTEIDEILALRILTMTDEEKLEVRNGDDRARRILERTETLSPDHFQKLHGALRGLRASAEASQ
ncbi:MAG: hypothetical protein ABSH09_03590 [Bryobacteraceae bacterium]